MFPISSDTMHAFTDGYTSLERVDCSTILTKCNGHITIPRTPHSPMQHFLSKGFCNQKSSRRSSLLSISVSELGAGAGDQHRSAPATSGTLAELQIFKK